MVEDVLVVGADHTIRFPEGKMDVLKSWLPRWAQRGWLKPRMASIKLRAEMRDLKIQWKHRIGLPRRKNDFERNTKQTWDA